MIRRVCFALLLFPLTATAQDWQFEKPVAVTQVSQGQFIHLEASGRRSIATSDTHIGVTWEDNRRGTPTVYVAFKEHSAGQFSKPVRLSEDSAAYEPAIAAFGGQYFIVGWEADEHVWLRIVTPEGAGPAKRISGAPARQISFSDDAASAVAAVWAEQNAGHFQIAHSLISRSGLEVDGLARRWVDDSRDRKDQLYPAVSHNLRGTVVAWEDRREGATRIYTAFAPADSDFDSYQLLNDFIPSPNPELGRGTGAMRVGLSSDGRDRVIAVWMDKRHFEGGYDVYAALSKNAGREFGPDEKAQDLLGENMPQWHACASMGPQGLAVVAWDDQRDGTPDVWFSWRQAGDWSDDYLFSNASGPGAQTSPALDFDMQGRLHGVWLARGDTGSTLYYVLGRPRE